MPSSPRSPDESTVRVVNGVGSNVPFWMTRAAPPCSVTKTRPSGATASAVGEGRPLARGKLRGSLAAGIIEGRRADHAGRIPDDGGDRGQVPGAVGAAR